MRAIKKREGTGIKRANINIEVSLIDAGGETAIDIFHLASQGSKLTEELQETLARGLITVINLVSSSACA